MSPAKELELARAQYGWDALEAARRGDREAARAALYAYVAVLRRLKDHL